VDDEAGDTRRASGATQKRKKVVELLSNLGRAVTFGKQGAAKTGQITLK